MALARQMLNKSKVNMKRDLENSITNYNESVLSVHQASYSPRRLRLHPLGYMRSSFDVN